MYTAPLQYGMFILGSLLRHRFLGSGVSLDDKDGMSEHACLHVLLNEPTLKSKACLKCLYFTIIIFDLCRYLEYFSYLYTINQTE